MRALLVPLEGGETIELVKDMTLVGRRGDCDLRLDHKSVSKIHCVIVKNHGMLLIRDLGSTNSTRVNGQRVRRAALLPNDQLIIANYKFRVQFSAEAAAVLPDERTQHIDAKDVAHLMKKAPAPEVDDASDFDLAQPPMLPNSLPDLYPDDE